MPLVGLYHPLIMRRRRLGRNRKPPAGGPSGLNRHRRATKVAHTGLAPLLTRSGAVRLLCRHGPVVIVHEAVIVPLMRLHDAIVVKPHGRPSAEIGHSVGGIQGSGAHGLDPSSLLDALTIDIAPAKANPYFA